MTDYKYDILCIGPAFVDMFIKVDDDFLNEIGFKKSTWNRVDEKGLKNILSKRTPYAKVSGGCAPNTAACAAMIGAKVAFIHKLANDEEGRMVVDEFKDMDICFKDALVDDAITGTCLILLSEDGERTMSPYFGVQAAFGPEDMDEELIKEAKITYIAGCPMNEKESQDALVTGFALAKKHGSITVLNTFDINSIAMAKDFYKSLMESGNVDILIGNRNEFMAYYEVETEDEIYPLLQKEKFMAVVTRSGEGSITVKDGEIFKVPGKNVDKVVDTTGAGDSFASGYLYALAKGRSIYECGAKGAEIAAETIAQLGARPKLSKEMGVF